MARLETRITALEQRDAQQRMSQRLIIVYNEDEPTDAWQEGDIVLRVAYEDPPGTTDLPGSDRRRDLPARGTGTTRL
jgi:hypothetical protein